MKDLTPVTVEVELPAWMDSFATKHDVDLSQVLQDALSDMFAQDQ